MKSRPISQATPTVAQSPAPMPAGEDFKHQGWAQYYGQCRDSAHNVAQKFLALLFQYSTFSVAVVTLVGFLNEKVSKVAAVGVSLLSIAGSVYFLTMVNTYFSIAGELSLLCERIERSKLFGAAADANEYGIFHNIAQKSNFYLSKRLKSVVRLYTFTLLMMAVIAFLAVAVSYNNKDANPAKYDQSATPTTKSPSNTPSSVTPGAPGAALQPQSNSQQVLLVGQENQSGPQSLAAKLAPTNTVGLQSNNVGDATHGVSPTK